MKAPQQTKTCSKSTKNKCFRNVTLLKSVAESGFGKSSGLHINNSDGILLLVKLQDFNINDSERVTDRVCF